MSMRMGGEPRNIGVSGHKNSYSEGVRDGNWVEELAGVEASYGLATMQEPAAPPAVAPAPTGRSQFEPKKDESFEMMFSHGVTFGEKYQASMYRMHFTDPATRERGPSSRSRVHNTFYYGNKYIDLKVSPTDPNPPTSLLEKKRAQWAAESQPTTAHDATRWQTTSATFGM